MKLDAFIEKGKSWFRFNHWQLHKFQEQAWTAWFHGESGIINAPTGSGKTYALWIPALLDFGTEPELKGLKMLWITPLRALSTDILLAMTKARDFYKLPVTMAIRTGDTSPADKQKIKTHPPHCLITTPESLHIMISQKNYTSFFRELEAVIIDEWHELLSTKRAVQVELGLSRLKSISKNTIRIWGISATIGNIDQALAVLTGNQNGRVIRADIKKETRVISILPDEVEKFPWSGFLGIRLLPKIMPLIRESKTTLLFTNTRSQTEIWYQKILNAYPDMAGLMAMHHGSIDTNVRAWVEDALHKGSLKLVICTSSLDLGVDFRPVDTVIQVGSPRGIARFLQRAGRSGHRPGEISTIYFVPTHSLELIEGAALRQAIMEGDLEDRKPLENSFDVLVQYLVTLATGAGFYEEDTLREIKSTYSFHHITRAQWKWALSFITSGGHSLHAYQEFTKVGQVKGLYVVQNRRIASIHRLSIGTIVGDPVVNVKYLTGGHIGTVEESFVAKLKKGDNFWFAGRSLEFIRFKDMTVLVRKSKRKTGLIPSWQGGRMPLSSKLSEKIRTKLTEYQVGMVKDPEMEKILPLLNLQNRWSIVPDEHTLLIENFVSTEGYHLCFYPFEGRFVHEVLAAVLAYRIGKLVPNSFSIAMNDYGFELLSVNEYPVEEILENDIFSMDDLDKDIMESINHTEMAKRKFRDIAAISGLVFQGYPGKYITGKHMQSSSQILFNVFHEYDPENLLLKQSMDEVISLQLERSRLLEAMKRINSQKIMLRYPEKPTPFAFPIMADRLREKLSTEQIINRIEKMQLQLEKLAGSD